MIQNVFQNLKSIKISSSLTAKYKEFFKYSLIKNVSPCNKFAHRLISYFTYYSFTQAEEGEMRNISQINRTVETELAQK